MTFTPAERRIAGDASMLLHREVTSYHLHNTGGNDSCVCLICMAMAILSYVEHNEDHIAASLLQPFSDREPRRPATH